MANAKDFLTQIYKYFLAAMGVVVHRDVDVNMVVDWGWGCACNYYYVNRVEDRDRLFTRAVCRFVAAA